MKPFEIFKSGHHTSSQGQAISFSDADLADVAASYDPALHEAPIVVGHPKTNAPAFGWIKGLSVRGGRLVAEPHKLDPAFAEMVRDGKYAKVSVALYDPTSAGNPTPGKYHVRHVGFLGAEPPAVKGLAGVEFADGSDIVTFAEIDFSEWRGAWSLDAIGRLFRGLRDHFIATSDIETADRLLPAWDIDQLTQAAAEMRAETIVAQPNFSEPSSKGEIMTTTITPADEAARLAAIEVREKAIADKEITFAEAARTAQAKDDAAFVDGVVKAGRLPIDLQATAVALFSELNDGVLTFSEGGQAKTTSPRAAFRDLLEKLPVPVVTAELAGRDVLNFADGKQVAIAIETEIRDAKAKGEDISPAVAAMRLTNRR